MWPTTALAAGMPGKRDQSGVSCRVMQDTNGLIPMVLFRWTRLPGWALFTVPNSEILKKANSVQPDRNRSTPFPLLVPLSSSSEAEGHITHFSNKHTKASLGKPSWEQSEIRKMPLQGSTSCFPTAGSPMGAERGTVPSELAREQLSMPGLREQPQPEGKRLWAIAGQGEIS